MSSKPPVDEKDVFNAARKIADAEAREQYLVSACGDDQETLQRVRHLLSVHSTKETFLESPAVIMEATKLLPVTEKSGDTIGPYKLLQQLGEGGMGTVYLAEQTEPVERRVALKVIKAGMDTRQVISRFEAERQTLAIMDHPNIARVLDAGTTDAGRPYFVMDLVKGVPITQYCDEHRLDTRERLQLFKDVCHAIQHAHQKGIIHRDIKPSNVLVAEYDDNAVPKIIDFGVAKATQQRLTEKTMFTEVGTVLGTIEYMSPEQAKLNELDIDTRSDIYSLGVLLYELLTGETPFDRKKLRSAAFDEMLRIIREEEPSRPSLKLSTSVSLPSIAANRKIDPKRLSTLVRGELDWIVMKALEKDRSRRYDTANAFADDIGNYLNNEAVLACPPTTGYRFRKFARRNKGVLAVTVLIASLLLAGLGGTSWQAIRATRAEEMATAEALRADREATRAGREAERARQEAELAVAERNRSDESLDLAFEALDEVYLRSVGRDRLLSPERHGSATKQPLSDAEKELLQLAMNFYGELANQDQSGDRASLRTAAALNRLGKIQDRFKDRKSASQSFQQSLERLRDLGPQSDDQAKYWRELGTAYLGLGDLAPWKPDASDVFEKAIEAFSKGLDSDPVDVASLTGRSLAYEAINDEVKAVEDAVRAAELEPKVAQRQLSLFWRFLFSQDSRVQDASKALEHAEKAVLIAPRNAEAWALLGRASWAVHRDLDRSESELNRAFELNPDNYVVRVQRAIVFRLAEQAERALPEINVAVRLRPTDHYALRHRGELLQKLERYDEALESYAEAEKDNPNDFWLYDARKEIYRARGETRKYEEDLTRAIELKPLAWYVYKRRAAVRFELGRFDEALDDLKTALKHNPDDTSTLVWISLTDLAACTDEGFKKGLMELASSAVETEKNKLALAQNRVRLFVALGETERALQETDRALQQNPDNAGLWTELGVLHAEQADLTKACESFRKAFKLGPSWLTHYQLALCQASAGDLAGYRKTCQAMVDALVDSEKAVELNFTAWTAVLAPNALDDYEPAIQAAQAAVKKSSGDAQYLKTLGAVLYRAGQADRAIEELTKLAESSNEEQSKASPADGWYFLAMAHHAVGNQNEAEDYLRRADERSKAELFDETSPPLWNRRLTLDLLQREAAELISTSATAEASEPRDTHTTDATAKRQSDDVGPAGPPKEESDEP